MEAKQNKEIFTTSHLRLNCYLELKIAMYEFLNNLDLIFKKARPTLKIHLYSVLRI